MKRILVFPREIFLEALVTAYGSWSIPKIPNIVSRTIHTSVAMNFVWR